MAKDLATLDIRDGETWRAWLAENHAASPGVWLVFHKRHTGVACISYEAAVRQALCFGWIDSLVRRLDDDRYVRKFTPRNPRSNWSPSNRRRWVELRDDGLLADAGLAAAPTDIRAAPQPAIPELPDYKRPARHCRHFVAWIHTAKRPATRKKRIRESIALLSAGRKLGLK